MKGPHREVVGATVVDSELFCEVIQVKTVTGIKAFLILPMTTFYLAIVARYVGTNELVANAQFGSSDFK